MDAAWAYARSDGTPRTIGALLPRLSGVDGVRLRLDRDGSETGPPKGATRYSGVWQSGRSRGSAEVLVLPFSSWGCEIHVGIRPPERFGGLLMRSPRHLGKIAQRFADECTKRGLLGGATSARSVRFVTHYGIDAGDVQSALKICEEVLSA